MAHVVALRWVVCLMGRPAAPVIIAGPAAEPGIPDLAAYIHSHDRASGPLGCAYGRVACRPVAGRRPGHGPADGACASPVPDLPAAGQAPGPGRGRPGGRVLHGAGGLGGLPCGRLRTGEVVRRRHGAQDRLPARRLHRPRRARCSCSAIWARAGPCWSGPGSGPPSPARGAGPPRRCWRTTGSRRTAWPARLGLAQQVRDSVEQTFERWDGKGVPKGVQGEEILVTSRLVALADVVEVFHRAGGTDAAVAVARQRRGTQFDPQVVDVFVRAGAGVVRGPGRGQQLGRCPRRRSRARGCA